MQPDGPPSSLGPYLKPSHLVVQLHTKPKLIKRKQPIQNGHRHRHHRHSRYILSCCVSKKLDSCSIISMILRTLHSIFKLYTDMAYDKSETDCLYYNIIIVKPGDSSQNGP